MQQTVQRKPLGNPVNRQRGQVARGVLAVLTVKPQPMVELMQTLGVSTSSSVRNHLFRMAQEGRIQGYATTGGVVRVWHRSDEIPRLR